jgi:anti-sigma factor ChrR (cupin superfamily)
MSRTDPARSADLLLAADYAAGCLDDAGVALVQARAAHDAAFAAVLAEQLARAAALDEVADAAAGQAAVPPPAGLFAAIEARIDAIAGLPGATTIRHASGRWHDVAPGIAVKLLNRDRAIDRHSYLVSMQPGARLPGHAHRDLEECVMLAGAVLINGHRIEAGDVHLVPAGVAHPVLESPEGALFYVRGEIDLVF